MAKGPECTVCAHRERAAIELGLARKVPFSALARRYKLGSHAVRRHWLNHMPPQLRAELLAGPDLPTDLERLRETESQSLMANLIALRHRLFAVMDRAAEDGDMARELQAAGRLHSHFELMGRLLGDLRTGDTTINNNLLISPAFIELRAELVRALRPHPEAARAVAAVLAGLETRFAEGMKTIDHSYASGRAPRLEIGALPNGGAEDAPPVAGEIPG